MGPLRPVTGLQRSRDAARTTPRRISMTRAAPAATTWPSWSRVRDDADAQRHAGDLRAGRRRASTTTGSSTLIADRIAFVPRYRQRIGRCRAAWPARSGSTTRTSTSTYHVRRSALPRPGSDGAARASSSARIVSRRLDRSRPLWEMYLVEGLEDGRFAILSKSPPDPGRRRRHHRPRAGHPRRRPRRRSRRRTSTGTRTSRRPRRRWSPARCGSPCDTRGWW